jgi:hypothetical protein
VQKKRLLAAFSVFALLGAGSCISNNGGGLGPGPDGGLPSLDGGVFPFDASGLVDGPACPGVLLPGCVVDASHPDVAVPDANVADATQLDAAASDASQPDTNAPDSNQPDTTQPDANVPDTNAPDANAADTNVPDTNVPDTNIPDTNQPDTFDGGCVVTVFGDYYVRTDGTAMSMLTGPHSVVVDNATGLPLATITEIVEQSDHACGLRSDGTVWCWPQISGSGNTNGDLGSGAFNGAPASYHATQVVTQLQDAGAEAYLTNVVHLSTRSQTGYTQPTCAIRTDRTVWCWGTSTAQGSPPDGLFWGTTGSTSAVPYAFPIVLDVPDAGPDAGDAGPPVLIHADEIAVGDRHACYLDTGAVFCWGANVAGNLGTGDTTYRAYPAPVQKTSGLPAVVDAVSAAYDLSCALAGGSVWCWGTNGWNQIGNPYVANQICNSNFCEPVPTPVEMTYPDGGPEQTPLVNAVSITGGYQSICTLDGAGNVRCWGAVVGGVSSVLEAIPYKPTVAGTPNTNVAVLSSYGGDFSSGLRYLTASGTLVRGAQVETPLCP